MHKTRTRSSQVLILCNDVNEIQGIGSRINAMKYNFELRKKSRSMIKDADAFSIVLLSAGPDIGHDAKVLATVRQAWPDIVILISVTANVANYEILAQLSDGIVRLPAPSAVIDRKIQSFLEPFTEPRRIHERAPVELTVSWSRDGKSVVLGAVSNVSAGGMFIKEDSELPARSSVVSFIVKGSADEVIEGKAIVRWVCEATSAGETSGFGVEFLNPEAADSGLLKSLQISRI